MSNPLLDKEFLYELNQFQHKYIYARIIVLNFNEMPLERIEGRVTGGSINIEGNSAVRRTCNLSLVAKDVNINDFYWSIGSKFTLEIGVNNSINSNYPEIIWFKQGIYVISSFNSSLSGNNYSISIGGKDKMCLLNGDMGGNLPASIDFGKIDTYINEYKKVEFEDYTQYQAGKYYIILNQNQVDAAPIYQISTDAFDPDKTYYTKISNLTQESSTIETIIREAIHTYGKEPYHNIIINDLADYGLELLEYRGDETLYLLYNETAEIYDQMITESNASEIIVQAENGNLYQINNLPIFNSAVNNFNDNRTKFTFVENGNKYSATKIEYGDVTGYRPTDLTYAGELISSVGESLTSILDKIKNMLGAFEYFYDLDGRFIFQAKKIYANNSWNTLKEVDGKVYSRDAVEESPYSYSFEDINLIQKFSNQPSLNNLKNDYSIWGIRKSATGAEIPIHSRYAIHKKPVYYKNFDGKQFCSESYELASSNDINLVDWREIIYQMAIDYFKYNQEIDFGYRVQNNNLKPGGLESYYPNGITEYEMFYTDIQGFWRQLYNCDINEDDKRLIQIEELENQIQLFHAWINEQKKSLNELKKQNQILIDKLNNSILSLKESEEIKKQIENNNKKLKIQKESLIEMINNEKENREYNKILEQIYQLKTEMEYIKYESIDGKYLTETFYKISILNPQSIEELNLIDNIDQQYVYFQEEVVNNDQKNSDKESVTKLIPIPNFKLKDNMSCFTNSIVARDNNNKFNGENIVKDITWQKGTWWKPHKWGDEPSIDYYLPSKQSNTILRYWNENVIEAPELLNFWFDFYDIENEIGQYAISVIGNRPKVINDSEITSIYFRSVPQVIFIYGNSNNLDRKTGYTYIQLGSGMEDLFAISAQGKSAEEETNELFNQHSYCNENINITSIPIYYLDVNTLIYINNDENNINGKYQINKLSIPLTFNGMMSITANKIINPVI